LHPDFYPAQQDLVIETMNNENDRYLIDRMTWNGEAHRGFFIGHGELVRGGVFRFYLR